MGGKYILIKAFTGRFGFDDSRISQLRTISQKQSNGDVPRDVYKHAMSCNKWDTGCQYNIGVGLSALLVSTNWAMREPLNRGTGKSIGSTFLLIWKYDNKSISFGAGWQLKDN